MSRPSSEFLQAKDWTRPWRGEGRKIHAKTVFIRRVAESLRNAGIPAEADQDCIVITKERTEYYPFARCWVVRFAGGIKMRWDIPWFWCHWYTIESGHERHRCDVDEKDKSDGTVSRMLRKHFIEHLPDTFKNKENQGCSHETQAQREEA